MASLPFRRGSIVEVVFNREEEEQRGAPSVPLEQQRLVFSPSSALLLSGSGQDPLSAELQAAQAVLFQDGRAAGRLVKPRVLVDSPGELSRLLRVSLIYDYWQPTCIDRKLGPEQHLRIPLDARYRAASVFSICAILTGRQGGAVALPGRHEWSGRQTAAAVSQHQQRIHYIRTQQRRYTEGEGKDSPNRHPLARSDAEFTIETGSEWDASSLSLTFNTAAELPWLQRVILKLLVTPKTPVDDSGGPVGHTSAEVTASRSTGAPPAPGLAGMASASTQPVPQAQIGQQQTGGRVKHVGDEQSQHQHQEQASSPHVEAVAAVDTPSRQGPGAAAAAVPGEDADAITLVSPTCRSRAGNTGADAGSCRGEGHAASSSLAASRGAAGGGNVVARGGSGGDTTEDAETGQFMPAVAAARGPVGRVAAGGDDSTGDGGDLGQQRTGGTDPAGQPFKEAPKQKAERELDSAEAVDPGSGLGAVPFADVASSSLSDRDCAASPQDSTGSASTVTTGATSESAFEPHQPQQPHTQIGLVESKPTVKLIEHDAASRPGEAVVGLAGAVTIVSAGVATLESEAMANCSGAHLSSRCGGSGPDVPAGSRRSSRCGVLQDGAEEGGRGSVSKGEPPAESGAPRRVSEGLGATPASEPCVASGALATGEEVVAAKGRQWQADAKVSPEGSEGGHGAAGQLRGEGGLSGAPGNASAQAGAVSHASPPAIATAGAGAPHHQGPQPAPVPQRSYANGGSWPQPAAQQTLPAKAPPQHSVVSEPQQPQQHHHQLPAYPQGHAAPHQPHNAPQQQPQLPPSPPAHPLSNGKMRNGELPDAAVLAQQLAPLLNALAPGQAPPASAGAPAVPAAPAGPQLHGFTNGLETALLLQLLQQQQPQQQQQNGMVQQQQQQQQGLGMQVPTSHPPSAAAMGAGLHGWQQQQQPSHHHHLHHHQLVQQQLQQQQHHHHHQQQQHLLQQQLFQQHILNQAAQQQHQHHHQQQQAAALAQGLRAGMPPPSTDAGGDPSSAAAAAASTFPASSAPVAGPQVASLPAQAQAEALLPQAVGGDLPGSAAALQSGAAAVTAAAAAPPSPFVPPPGNPLPILAPPPTMTSHSAAPAPASEASGAWETCSTSSVRSEPTTAVAGAHAAERPISHQHRVQSQGNILAAAQASGGVSGGHSGGCGGGPPGGPGGSAREGGGRSSTSLHRNRNSFNNLTGPNGPNAGGAGGSSSNSQSAGGVREGAGAGGGAAGGSGYGTRSYGTGGGGGQRHGSSAHGYARGGGGGGRYDAGSADSSRPSSRGPHGGGGGGGGPYMRHGHPADPVPPPEALPLPDPKGSCDLDRFISQIEPVIAIDPAKPPQQALKELCLRDLWNFYFEPSLYGREVFTLGGHRGASNSYFVPYLSAIQIFTPALPTDVGGTNRLYVSDDDQGWPKRMHLKFEYFEQELPFNRLPLYDQIELLSGSVPLGKPPGGPGGAAGSAGSSTGGPGGTSSGGAASAGPAAAKRPVNVPAPAAAAAGAAPSAVPAPGGPTPASAAPPAAAAATAAPAPAQPAAPVPVAAAAFVSAAPPSTAPAPAEASAAQPRSTGDGTAAKEPASAASAAPAVVTAGADEDAGNLPGPASSSSSASAAAAADGAAAPAGPKVPGAPATAFAANSGAETERDSPQDADATAAVGQQPAADRPADSGGSAAAPAAEQPAERTVNAAPGPHPATATASSNNSVGAAAAGPTVEKPSPKQTLQPPAADTPAPEAAGAQEAPAAAEVGSAAGEAPDAAATASAAAAESVTGTATAADPAAPAAAVSDPSGAAPAAAGGVDASTGTNASPAAATSAVPVGAGGSGSGGGSASGAVPAPAPSAAPSAPPSSSGGPASGAGSRLLYDMRLLDVHPASWFAVAWYPVYRIPDAPLYARFLTFHSFGPLVESMRNAHERLMMGQVAPYYLLSLPVVGLHWYNMQGERWMEPLDESAVAGAGMHHHHHPHGAMPPPASAPGGPTTQSPRAPPPHHHHHHRSSGRVSGTDVWYQHFLQGLQSTADRLARGVGLRVLGQHGAEEVRLRVPDYEFFRARS